MNKSRIGRPAEIASDLGVPERVLLFCLASGTDWERAGVMHLTAQQMLVRGFIGRDQGASRFKLTTEGRAVLLALMNSVMSS